MARTAPARPILDERLEEMLGLIDGADSVELKLTVPESNQRSAVRSLGMDPLEAQIRQVFFFDTPDLALDKAGLVVRARRVQGRGDDTVVKLRPVVPHELPESLRSSPSFGVEVDAMPGGFVCSGSLKAAIGRGDAVKAAVGGERPVRKLFTKEQRALFAEHAPAGVTFSDLAVLGPIPVMKLKMSPKPLGRKLVAELWLYPDGTRILELFDQVRPRRRAAGGDGGEGLPVRARHRPQRQAADQDPHGAELLLEGGQGRGGLSAQRTRASSQTRRWSELGKGKTPTGRKSGSAASGQ